MGVARCPACESADVRVALPDSPDVVTYRCGDCDGCWSETIPWQTLWPSAALPADRSVRANDDES
jgi:hypothetical protein